MQVEYTPKVLPGSCPHPDIPFPEKRVSSYKVRSMMIFRAPACQGPLRLKEFMFRLSLLAISISLLAGVPSAMAQTPPPAARPARPTPPTRDPNTPGYVKAKELPDGTIPPPNVDGNFIIGPTHNPAPEMTAADGVPHGTVSTLTMESTDSKIYPGIFREQGTFGEVDPKDPAKLIVTTSHPKPYSRLVTVYVPKQYVPGTEAPFIVGADGPDQALFTALDSLIAQHRVPPMVAISIRSGGG